MAAVPPAQNCLSVVFIDPGDNSGYNTRFREQLLVPFKSETVKIYSPSILMVISLELAVKPDGPDQEYIAMFSGALQVVEDPEHTASLPPVMEHTGCA